MYKVLIVEDDPMVAMINEQYIARCRSFSVAGKCSDGKSALTFLEENKVDLIIMDVYMPCMDGFETLRQIRRLQYPADVIMVTAANDRQALEEALHLGADDYLVKPFTFDRFRMALDKFASQANALKNFDKLNQKTVDYIIENSRGRSSETALPKGIQEKTLSLILNQLRENRESWLTGEKIAEMTGITSVTARRYLNYLSQTGRVFAEIDYSTGGRPCMLYRISE